jgi:carbamoyl-phosphate synthase small subunit
MEGLDLVTGALDAGGVGLREYEAAETTTAGEKHFALIDFGAKKGIIRELRSRGCRVTVLPHSATLEDIEKIAPQAVLLSNGPGDPAVLESVIVQVRRMIGRYPVFGICLGHQLIALALGAKTYKMKFGHHGLNHPVRDEGSGKIIISSQNHGFAVDENSLPERVEVTMRNANDGTVEGLRHEELPVVSVQFHPEAAPGPHDSRWIFDDFLAKAAGKEDESHAGSE